MMKDCLNRPGTRSSLMKNPLRCLVVLLAAAPALHAQDAKAIVSAAVQTELAADRNDHSAYMYYDHDITPDHDTLAYFVETPQGNLQKKLQDHGRPLSPEQRNAEEQRLRTLLADPAAQARARNNSSHDDNQAEEMLKLLPQAYLWTVASEDGNLITLNFKPDPNFSPSGFEAKVLSAMGGQIVVARKESRIRTIKGSLLDDVTFFLGIGGRLRKGGSFEVQRRQVAPDHWQMVETHVHIAGHALFFKTIGSQEDEQRTDFKPSPAQTVQQAGEILAKM